MNEVLFDAIPDSAYPALNITEGSQSVARYCQHVSRDDAM